MSRLGGVLLVAAALLAVPASAGAATTVGADLTQTINVGGAAPCGSATGNQCSFLTLTKTSGAPELGSPSSGILTSVRVRTAGPAVTVAVRVLRADGVTPGAFLNVGPETLVPVTADTGISGGHITEAAGLHHPISMGDRLGIGWTQPGGLTGVYADAFSASAACAFRQDPDGTHAVDTTVTYNSAGCGVEFLVQGTVEADADHDGFGDDTQDQCPTDGTTHGPCAVAPVSAPAPVSKKKCKKKKHRRAAVSAKKKCRKKH